MESRSIKFNIKNFIEDYAYSKESGDTESEEELLSKFDKFFMSSEYKLRVAIQRFLQKDPIAVQYPVLQQLATKNATLFWF